MRGDVDVRYVRCVSELKSGRGDVVSSAAKNIDDRTARKRMVLTSSVVELRRNADTGAVLRGKCKVGLAHGG